MDTYVHKQLGIDGKVAVNIQSELFKINELDDYKVDPSDIGD